jgi:hypothetical protein
MNQQPLHHLWTFAPRRDVKKSFGCLTHFLRVMPSLQRNLEDLIDIRSILNKVEDFEPLPGYSSLQSTALFTLVPNHNKAVTASKFPGYTAQIR